MINQTKRAVNKVPAEVSEPSTFLDKQGYKDQLHDSDLKPVTKTIKKITSSKRRYVNTPNEVRLELIDAVHTYGEKIKHAAKRLGINYSSAKAICQIYKREGRSDKIIAKRKDAKGAYKISRQNNSIFQASAEEEFDIKCSKEDNYDDEKSDTSNDDIQSEADDSPLEPQTQWKEEGFTHDIEKKVQEMEDLPAQASYQTSTQINQSQQQINQTITQNNFFVSVQPSYLPQSQQSKTFSADEAANVKTQSGCNYINIANIMNPAALSNLQAQQNLLSQTINPLISQPSLNLFPAINFKNCPLLNDIDKQYQTSSQNSHPSHTSYSYQNSHQALNSYLPLSHQFQLYPGHQMLNPSLYMDTSACNLNLPFMSFPQMMPNRQMYGAGYDPRISHALSKFHENLTQNIPNIKINKASKAQE